MEPPAVHPFVRRWTAGVFAPVVCPSIEGRANRARPRPREPGAGGQQQGRVCLDAARYALLCGERRGGLRTDTHGDGAVGAHGQPGMRAGRYAGMRPGRLCACHPSSNLTPRRAGSGISEAKDRDGRPPCTMSHRWHPPRRAGALPLTSYGTSDMSRHLQTAPLHRHGVDRACHEASPPVRPNAALLCESWLRHGGPADIAGPPRADAVQPAGTTIFPCALRIPRETKSPCPPVVHCVPAPRGAPRPTCA